MLGDLRALIVQVKTPLAIRSSSLLEDVGRLEGASAGDEEFERQYRLGFVWLPRLLVTLQSYERERDRYPRLGDFCPGLAAAFDGLAAERSRRP